MSSVSIERSYAVRLRDWKTCSRVSAAPSRKMTTSYLSHELDISPSSEKAYVRGMLHFRFNESEQMLLVHTPRVMNMGINLSNIVKISGGNVRTQGSQ